MKKILLSLCLLTPLHSLGSPNYAGSINKVQLALEAIHGVGSGVGAKNQSCTLCHATTAGGPGNINGGFGTDFRLQAIALGLSQVGGGDLPATGFESLESIFSDPSFASLDSDNDGVDNQNEFNDNTDPADDIPTSLEGGGTSGGCGFVLPPKRPKPPTTGLMILLLPVALLLFQRRQAHKKSRLY